MEVRALSLRSNEDIMHVQLTYGRTISVRQQWFPAFRDATPQQRQNWRLIGDGIGIHWEDLDENLSVAGLMRV